jgi:hypothetical protein
VFPVETVPGKPGTNPEGLNGASAASQRLPDRMSPPGARANWTGGMAFRRKLTASATNPPAAFARVTSRDNSASALLRASRLRTHRPTCVSTSRRSFVAQPDSSVDHPADIDPRAFKRIAVLSPNRLDRAARLARRAIDGVGPTPRRECDGVRSRQVRRPRETVNGHRLPNCSFVMMRECDALGAPDASVIARSLTSTAAM